MPNLGEIGEMTEMGKSGAGFSFDWRIPDFLSLDGERADFYESPAFDACGGRWFLRIFPLGIWNHSKSGCVSLSLLRVDKGPPETFNVMLGIRGPEGVENRSERSQEFSEFNDACNWYRFCSRSNSKRKDESRLYVLVPGDALVIALHIMRDVPSVARVSYHTDSSSQTVDEAEEVEVPAEKNQSSEKQDSSTQTVDEAEEVPTEKNKSSEKQVASDDEAEEENNENNNDEDMGESKNKTKVKNTKKISFPSRHAGVIRSLKAILAGGSQADFTLKSGGGEWPMHRAILEARSRHFEALFRGEWADTEVGVVPFDDVTDQDVLDCVLEFLYAGEVGGMSAENVFWIYDAAERFLLGDLKSVCVEYMREEMRPGMVCDALTLAETFQERELRESALQCFFREPARVCETDGWKRLKENHPAIIAELFEETIRRESKNRRK